MGRSQESFNKKEVKNKKDKKRKDKEAKRMARKDTKREGDSDDMMAYVDEFGRISTTPPDPTKKKVEIDIEDIAISTPRQADMPAEDPIRKGVVTFFNDSKGYGFIKDSATQDSVFVHVNNVLEEIKENNMVSFEVEMGLKGPSAVRVKIIREGGAKDPAKPEDAAAGEAPAAEAGEAPAVEAGDAPAVEAGDAPAVEAGDAPAVEAGDAPAADSKDAEAPKDAK
ncbi:MAG: cold shock CspA family protein [Litorivivens sp.]|jgi:cold shock CspA family protein